MNAIIENQYCSRVLQVAHQPKLGTTEVRKQAAPFRQVSNRRVGNSRFRLDRQYLLHSQTCRQRQGPHVCSALDVEGRETVQGVPVGVFEGGKEAASRRVLFNRIAPIYDQLNERLSFGQHRVWKRMAVKWARVRPGHKALDVCCGTGDLTFLLAQVVGPSGQVTGLDFAQEMLDDAAVREQQEAASWPCEGQLGISWIQGDAMALPFEDCSFDSATMGYGLRNVSDIPMALQELNRVLKPGSCVSILDFNNNQDPMVDNFQAWFLENVVVPAAAEQGVEQEYRYLRPSIKRFPTGRKQEELAQGAGFASARHYEIGFGLMGVLVARKGSS